MEDDDFADHIPADRDVVNDFIYGGGPGPDIDDLHFDCRRGKGSPWNKKAIELIADELMNRVDEDPDRRWPALSYDLVQELVWNRFQHLMVVWRDAQPKTGIDGMGERPDELETRLNESRDIKLKTYRHFTRRNSVSVSFCDQHMELPNRTTQKYRWRKRVVDWQVEFREMINPAPRDLWIWKRMRETLQWYGQEGMSSEESEVEDLEEIYCPKHLPWRRKSASEMMDLIDRVRGLPGQKSHSKKGRPPKRRIRDKSNGVSSRAACKGLPADLYDADWFDGLMRSERKALKASRETFKFVNSFVGIAEDLEGETMDDEKMRGSHEEYESEDL